MTRYPNTTANNPRSRLGTLIPRLGTLILGAVVLAFCGTTWVRPAHAQINPFRGYKGPTLTKEDLAAGRAAAQKLLESDPPSVGQAVSWTGPSTGDRGTLTIRRVFEQARMPCRSAASEVLYQRSHARRNYTFTACRTASGAWKLAD